MDGYGKLIKEVRGGSEIKWQASIDIDLLSPTYDA